ncbi:MAG: HNH endonuclease [Nanoarchaeota archaeon]|nr:HNH endonuclease [Nanoarchaeota archaeon]
MAKTYVNKNGYRCFADSRKQVSRWVAEQKIGRPLKDTDVVHHGYKGKGCNNPDNLWLFKNQSEHITKAHSKKRSWFD